EQAEFPGAEQIYEAFGPIQRAEALFTHEQAGLWPARRDEYGADVLSRLELAARERLPDYLAASAERQRIEAQFARIFHDADVLLTPVSAGPPLPIGDEEVLHRGRPLAFRELVMSYTVPQDLAGLPACAVRAGFDELGIPVGIQFTGRLWAEGTALRAAQGFYEATPEVHSVRPPLLDAPPMSDFAREGA